METRAGVIARCVKDILKRIAACNAAVMSVDGEDKPLELGEVFDQILNKVWEQLKKTSK